MAKQKTKHKEYSFISESVISVSVTDNQRHKNKRKKEFNYTFGDRL